VRVAFHPGCVSKGACPELFVSAMAIAEPLGLDLVELTEAPCTGAGVLSEQNPDLADCLNGLTLAMAEEQGAQLMTICSTCQGVLSQVNYDLARDAGRLAKVNATIADQGFQYRGTTTVKHLLWLLFEDVGIERVRTAIKRPLSGLRIAPFYGCYILRPLDALGIRERPERKTYLEQLIAMLGAQAVEYSGATKCCGFPMLTMNREKSLAMAGKHMLEAKDKGADLLVTPCPLCHLNLDGQQPDAARVLKRDIDVPILHLPQLLGLAFGLEPEQLRVNRHVVSTRPVLDRIAVKV
jgi:succinate dehydrogenase / fumarate reductase, cytochrome b subunit